MGTRIDITPHCLMFLKLKWEGEEMKRHHINRQLYHSFVQFKERYIN